jgi:2-C-methyl-D-erythritol 4-phosphate cytidylyltransferase
VGSVNEREGPRAGAFALAAPSRLASGIDLLRATAAGRPLFVWPLLALEGARQIEAVVLLVEPERVEEARQRVAEAGLRTVAVVGIAEHVRAEARGWLDALAPALRLIVLHDASRPLVTAELVARGLTAARATGAASAALPVKETIKRVREGEVVATLDRSRLALLQTPQVFDRAALEAAFRTAMPPLKEPRDALAAVLHAGRRVATFPGDPENTVVASPDDLALADRLLRARHAL